MMIDIFKIDSQVICSNFQSHHFVLGSLSSRMTRDLLDKVGGSFSPLFSLLTLFSFFFYSHSPISFFPIYTIIIPIRQSIWDSIIYFRWTTVARRWPLATRSAIRMRKKWTTTTKSSDHPTRPRLGVCASSSRSLRFCIDWLGDSVSRGLDIDSTNIHAGLLVKGLLCRVYFGLVFTGAST